jgi:hypothetical protein
MWPGGKIAPEPPRHGPSTGRCCSAGSRPSRWRGCKPLAGTPIGGGHLHAGGEPDIGIASLPTGQVKAIITGKNAIPSSPVTISAANSLLRLDGYMPCTGGAQNLMSTLCAPGAH